MLKVQGDDRVGLGFVSHNIVVAYEDIDEGRLSKSVVMGRRLNIKTSGKWF